MSCIVHCARNPVQIVENNHFNALSDIYFPNEELERKHGQDCHCLKIVVGYPIGMIGYALQTILRAIQLLGDLLFFLCAHSYHDHAVVTLDTFVSLLISIVGIVLPPLAYKLDSLAKAHFQEMTSLDARVDYNELKQE